MGARKLGLAAAVIAALAGTAWLWLANCTGPDVSVQGSEIEAPQQPGQPYVVRAVLHNQRAGSGQVRVSFTLTNRETGRVYGEDTAVEIDKRETVTVMAEISAPEAEYELSVKTRYPP